MSYHLVHRVVPTDVLPHHLRLTITRQHRSSVHPYGEVEEPLMVGDPVKAKRISDILLAEYGIYVQPINYPTVPRKTERLRITPSPLHTDADIEHLVSALSELWSQCALARQVA
jgi:7-keto-8-aminopelargonate synthetase-like enzyme